MEYSIVRLSDVPEMEHDAAMRFHEKWNIPLAAYLESMDDCLLRRGVAGALLRYVVDDMRSAGIGTLYLLTDLCGFYERFGWEYLCGVRGDGEERLSRMYIHR